VQSGRQITKSVTQPPQLESRVLLSSAQDRRIREHSEIALSKTSMCKFHVLGECRDGASCKFAHSSGELRRRPDFRCTRLCTSLINSGHCLDPGCSFAHSAEELRNSRLSGDASLVAPVPLPMLLIASEPKRDKKIRNLAMSKLSGGHLLPPGLQSEETPTRPPSRSTDGTGKSEDVDRDALDDDSAQDEALSMEPMYVSTGLAALSGFNFSL